MKFLSWLFKRHQRPTELTDSKRPELEDAVAAKAHSKRPQFGDIVVAKTHSKRLIVVREVEDGDTRAYCIRTTDDETVAGDVYGIAFEDLTVRGSVDQVSLKEQMDHRKTNGLSW